MNFRSCHWRDLALEPPGPSCRGVLAGLPHTTYMLPLGTPWRVLVYGIVFLLVGVPLVFDFATLPAKTHTEREREREAIIIHYIHSVYSVYIYIYIIYIYMYPFVQSLRAKLPVPSKLCADFSSCSSAAVHRPLEVVIFISTASLCFGAYLARLNSPTGPWADHGFFVCLFFRKILNPGRETGIGGL